MKRSIHPSFRLNGVPLGSDLEAFCTQVQQTFATDEQSAVYGQDILDFIRRYTDDSDMLICQTSGSTGKPKPIQLEKKRMEVSARLTCRRFGLDESIRALLCLPVSYIAGKMMIVRALVAGWHLEATVPSSRFLGQTDGQFDFVAVVPMQLYQSIGELHRVRIILVGGGSISEGFLDKLNTEELPCTTIYQSYAMTETITHVAVRELFPQLETCYTALEGISFSLSPEGTLVVNAPAVAKDILVTHDVAYLLDNHRFIWRGRADTMINSGGIKIFPEDTEAILSKAIFGNFFVAGIPDEQLGSRQILFVEGRKEDYPDLEPFIAEHLDTYHRPKEMVFIPCFRQTHTGKTDRKKITEDYIDSLR